MLSRPIINASTILKHNSAIHESYIEQYAKDKDFKDVYATLSLGKQVEELDYYIKEKLLYHLRKLCIPQAKRVNIIREAHTSLISGHFGVSKTLAQLERFCYWTRMNDIVSRYIKGCTMCVIRNPSNRKLGLYNPLPIPSRPWESVSMDFVGGFPKSRKGHDYLYVVMDRFSEVCILTPCNKQVTAEQTAKLFFQNVWFHLSLPTSIVSN